jgi:CRP-like cAMP-binding protein
MIERLNNLIPAERLDSFLEIGKKREIKATHYFIKAGEVPHRVAFVASGLFRYVYINDKGHEFTKGFIVENNFISSYSAMILGKPSYFWIEALENAQIFEIHWADFKKLLEKAVFWNKFLLKFVERGYIIKEKRERDLLLLDAETRYKDFLRDFPGIDQRVNLGIIASYLGIKQETLSRIRRRVIF